MTESIPAHAGAAIGRRRTTDARSGRRARRSASASGANATASAAFLTPIVAVLIVLYAVPLAYSFYYSFTDYNAFSTTARFVGLANYRAIFTTGTLLSGLTFTLLFAFSTTVLITVLALPLAVQLNKLFLGRNLVRSLLFFLSVPSQAILGLVFQYVFSPLKTGMANSILDDFGLGPIPWLSNSTLARVCVIVVGVWTGVGWHATLYLAYMQAIPGDLYEQAEIDGANRRQQFLHITLPQLVPAVVVSTFLIMTAGLKVYDLPFAMLKGGPGYATNTITQSIIIQGIAQSQIGVGSALAVLFTLASIFVILVQMAVSRAAERRFG